MLSGRVFGRTPETFSAAENTTRHVPLNMKFARRKLADSHCRIQH